MARTLHVWQNSPQPDPTQPYASKWTAARQIQAALDLTLPGDTVVVHGDCGPRQQCIYYENIIIIKPGLRVVGVSWPIVDGRNLGATVHIQTNSPIQVTFEGFEITGGRSPANGGGILVDQCSATISQNCIHHNIAQAAGGGIFVQLSPQEYPVYVVSNSIHSNYAQEYGGGIGATSANRNRATAVMVTANLIGPDNHAEMGGGIGIARCRGSIADNEILENWAWAGGGVSVFSGDSPQTRYTQSWYGIDPSQGSIRDNNIHHNQAHYGGGVSVMWGTGVAVSGSTIEDNKASRDGGGLFASVKAKIQLTGCSISTNEAALYGGGLGALSGSRLEISGPNFIGANVSLHAHGGGIAVLNGDLVMNGAIGVFANEAEEGQGGGIYVESSRIRPWWTMPRWPFAPFWMTSFVQIDGLNISGNRALLEGAAIAVHLKKSKFHMVGCSVRNCKITSNSSSLSPQEGCWIALAPNAQRGFSPEFLNCWFQAHNSLFDSNAVAIYGSGNNVIKPVIKDTMIQNNQCGVELYRANANIHGNLFSPQGLRDIRGRKGHWEIEENRFLGFGATIPMGVESVNMSGFLKHNIIDGHGTYGVRSISGTVTAKRNWWGSPAGPTEPWPGGSPGGGGDSVSRNVIWRPHLRTMPPLPNLTPFFISTPNIVPRNTPLVPDCEFLASGEVPSPGDSWLPPPPEED